MRKTTQLPYRWIHILFKDSQQTKSFIKYHDYPCYSKFIKGNHVWIKHQRWMLLQNMESCISGILYSGTKPLYIKQTHSLRVPVKGNRPKK